MAVYDGQHRFVIELKCGMGKSLAVGRLLSDRALVRQELGQLEAKAVAHALRQRHQAFPVNPTLVQQLILEHERKATHERIARLRRLLRALDVVIRIAIRWSRSWAAQTHVFLVERAWFLCHGDRPPRIAPAVARVLDVLGRTSSMLATA
jgi:hypothetical protein